MGQVLGAVAGVASGIMGMSAGNDAAKQSMTGFNYLTSGAGAPAASTLINNGTTASNGQTATQGAIAGLLGQGPNSAANQAAFNNYLGSTGYQFQLGQGTQAIDSNAASRGLLQSGANAKALAGYGQNLASTTFNNYLGQLGGLNAAQGQTAALGENMLSNIGSNGTGAGASAGNAIMNGANAFGNGLNTAAGALSKISFPS